MNAPNVESLGTSTALSHEKEQKSLIYKLSFLLFVILVAVVASYVVVTELMHRQEEARSELLARTAAAKDVELRDWMATFGGIFVPITEATPPNPYLPIEGRDITTPSGLELTKMNPAYVTRLLHERWGTKYGMIGHITSTKPVRPQNMAAPWEAESLAYLIRTGESEFSTIYVDENTGVRYMRHMTPLYAKQGCLVCHTTQGYVVGDIMGGISNTVPIDQLTGADASVTNALLAGYILFTFFIVLLLFFGGKSILKRNEARYKAEMALKDLAENLELRVQERTAELQRFELKLREERDLLNNILKASPMPMYIADEQDIVRVVNPAAELLLPLCLGCRSEIAWKDIVEQHKLYKHIQSHNEVKDQPVRLRSRLNNEVLETRTSITNVVFEEQNATLVWVQDISDLVHAKEQAENFSRAKSDFLARMSHEIRTPMNAILGMTYLFQQNPLEDWQKRYINKIQDASKGLLGIINDILDFSKIEAGKMTLEVAPFSLADMVENLSNICSPMAEDKKLELLFFIAPELPDFYKGDMLRLTQVLINLLTNAIKFTNFGEVVLKVYPREIKEDVVSIAIEVQDTGIGLSEEQMQRLFQSFEQADVSTTRKYGGTGLGLVISDQLVRMMGGEIKVESALNQGTTFSFVIPLCLHKSNESFLYTNLSGGERILIVDDNESARTVLKDMIAGFGFSVDTVASGHIACDSIFWEAGNNKPYDLVLLDWKMPGLDGFECAKMINELPIDSPPKLLMISAFGLDEYTMKGQGYGFTDYVSKPVTRSALWNVLAKALGKEHLAANHSTKASQNLEANLNSIKNASVLLVEDNETNQEVASKLLRRVGMDVQLANNGLEAVNAFKSRTFDLIFMDIQMPVMDGLEAARRIRSEGSKYAESVPIVAMTAHAMASDKQKSFDAGMNDHITKPIDPTTLQETLLKWIKPKENMGSNAAELVANNEGSPVQTKLNISGLDLAKALLYMGDDMESLIHHLQQFPVRYRDYPDHMEEFANTEQWENATRTAHTLKGVAATLGLTNLSNQAAILEKSYGQSLIDAKVLEELKSELIAICKAIEEQLPPQESPKEVAFQAQDIDKVLTLIEQIPTMMEEDIHKSMATIKELKKFVPMLIKEEHYNQLFTAIYEFNHESAKKAITSITLDLEDKR